MCTMNITHELGSLTVGLFGLWISNAVCVHLKLKQISIDVGNGSLCYIACDHELTLN